MKDPLVYLHHIHECIARIREYTADGRVAFFQSTLIQDAVVRNLQTLAESTQRLPEELKTNHPEIEWHAIAGFRNVLAHDYLRIDPELV